jgi:hypothetical protein
MPKQKIADLLEGVNGRQNVKVQNPNAKKFNNEK